MTSTFDAFDDNDEHDFRVYELSGRLDGVDSYAGESLRQCFDDIAEAITNFDPDQVAQRIVLLHDTATKHLETALHAFFTLSDLWQRNPDAELDVDDYGPFGRLDVQHSPTVPATGDWAAVPRTGVRKGVRVLRANTMRCTSAIYACGDWMTNYAEHLIGWYETADPERVAAAAVHNIVYLTTVVVRTVVLWQREVFDAHRKLARSQTGLHPPSYVERERQMAEIFDKIDRRFAEEGQ